jgi:hypothetical protein
MRTPGGGSLPEEPLYRGRPLRDLEVIDIAWSEWSERHLRNRRERYPNDPDELDIEPEWATEAALDPYGRLSLTQQNDLRVTGWSEHAPSASWSNFRQGRVLRVTLKPVEMDEGYWSGVTAAPASKAAAEFYWRRRRGRSATV